MLRVLRAALLAAGLLPISHGYATDSKLLEAVMSRDQKAVAALIKSGADVNAARADGSTPLAWAINREAPEIVALLLKAGANANAADENGESPLTLACTGGNLAIARLLLDAKANPNTKRWNGETPLFGAVNA